MKHFTPEEDSYIKAHYLTTPASRIAKQLGRSEGTVRQRLQLLGITVPPEIAQAFKRNTQFTKGSSPINKGKKWKDFMSAEGMAASRKTTFRKGQSVHNEKHDGAISIRNDKTGRQYKWIRISKGVWRMLHVYLWEQANGKVPEGCVIIFKDADSLNVELANLQCVTLRENMLRNSLWKVYPRDIAETIQLRGALNRQINKHLKTLHK